MCRGGEGAFRRTPTSSTLCERVFSKAGKILSKKPPKKWCKSCHSGRTVAFKSNQCVPSTTTTGHTCYTSTVIFQPPTPPQLPVNNHLPDFQRTLQPSLKYTCFAYLYFADSLIHMFFAKRRASSPCQRTSLRPADVLLEQMKLPEASAGENQLDESLLLGYHMFFER